MPIRPPGPRRPRTRRVAWRILTATMLALALSAACLLTAPAPPHARAATVGPDHSAGSDEEFTQVIRPFLRKYCVSCHGKSDPPAKLSFHQFTQASEVTRARKQFMRALRMLSIDGMPPDDWAPRPNAVLRARVVRWLDARLHRTGQGADSDPGRVTVRRLNRIEYNNTVRDLVGVAGDWSKDFPSDEVGYGFDNIGDVLSISPLLLEKYMNAAERIAAAAIVSDPAGRNRQRFGAAQLTSTAGGGADGGFRMLSSSGSVGRRVTFPADDEYLVRFEASADQAGPEPAKMEIRLDGKPVKVHEIRGHRKPATYEVRLRVTKGNHRVEAAFVNDYYNPQAKNPRDRDRNLAVGTLEIAGPLHAAPPAAHRRILFTRPGKGKSARQAATEIFGRFMKRAYRRPVSAEEVARIVRLVERALGQGESFERAVQVGLQAVLVSPHFLFRIEPDAKPNDPDTQRRLNGHELACRLSYFLWSTMPDDELTALADAGKLGDEAVLLAQARRMLKDARSAALVENFAGQWLNLRNLDDAKPDAILFPGFSPQLRHDMRRETELFVQAVIREDRSVTDFLSADFTFVNERLAKHYGIEGVRGEAFRRVALPASQRRGIITHASILTLTSLPTRTSLVKRGKWVLDNLLGVELPPPPANVPNLAATTEAKGGITLREALKLHASAPGCSSCHKTLDPLGFGLENFDAIGRWRTRDGKHPVDAGGTMPSGESFRGPVELVAILSKRHEQFTRCLARKMLTYALGRGLEYYDRRAVDRILAGLAKGGYRFSVLVDEIVRSKPFRMRRGDAGVTR